MISAVDNLFSVGRKERTAVITEFMCQLLDVGSIKIHRINVEVAVPDRGKGNFVTGGGDDCFSIISRSVGQSFLYYAICIREKNIVSRIERPDVYFVSIRNGRALFISQMGGGIENMFSVGIKKRACR